MLSKPEHGWTNFTLNDQFLGSFSYLTNLPIEWLDQAIHGLETLHPFCVHGNCEPAKVICVVSHHSCFVFTAEDEPGFPSSVEEANLNAISMDMLTFCRELHRDITENFDAWCRWRAYSDKADNDRPCINGMQQKLSSRLERLAELIDEKNKFFSEGYVFW